MNKELNIQPIVKLLQRDVPAEALPYFKALRECVWELERLRETFRLSRAVSEFGEKTGASPWT